MGIFLAPGDAFRIDSTPCAVTQFLPNMHETGFLLGHSHILVKMAVVINRPIGG